MFFEACWSFGAENTVREKIVRTPKFVTFIVILIFNLWSPAQGQQSPLDLTDSVDLSPLTMEEIMGGLVVAEGADEGTATLPAARGIADGWSLRYRYSQAKYCGYLEGSQSVTFSQVLERFPVVPTVIRQEVHQLDLRKDLRKDLQLGLLVPFIRQSTDHIRRKGDPFNISSEGVGDVELLFTKHSVAKKHLLSSSLGLTLPTGSIDEKGTTPRGPGTQLPYTMQIGSGTFDFKPSLTYVTERNGFRVGLQGLAVLRTGDNDRDYRLGDRYQLAGFGSYRVGRWLEPALKIRYIDWDNIKGADAVLNPDLAPVANSRLYGGERVECVLGLSIYPGAEVIDNTSIDVQYATPMYESLTGPQPGLDYQISISARMRF